MLDTTVEVPGDAGADVAPYGWDWSATTHDAAGSPVTVSELVTSLVCALEPQTVIRDGKGLQGWTESVDAFDGGGYRLGRVYFGGRSDVHVVATSAAADVVRERVADIYQPKTARVDTRADTLVPFDDLRELCMVVAGQKARVTYMESTVAGLSTGRTIYVGAPSSAVRVRVYEKWLESPGLYVEGTNRVEVQVRPPSRVKDIVSGWSRTETFCASELTRRLAAELGTDLAKPESLQKAKATPDLERSLEWMGRHYGKAVDQWLGLSGGDMDKVLDHLIKDPFLAKAARG